MKITEYLKNNLLYLDGGMGTLLQKEGLPSGELPERFNISHPHLIQKIHKDYFDSGSNVVNTNTFGANILKFSEEELDAVICAAVKNARIAKEQSVSLQEKWIALDIGPTGHLLAPYGDLDFEDAVSVFAKTVQIGVKYGVDLIFIETMNDSYETKAALLAAKENCDLPIFVSNAYSEDGNLMTGASPCAMVSLLEGMGADAIGMNCSFGPKALKSVAEEYLKYASVPVILKPNAGIPKSVNGKTSYDVLPDEFAFDVSLLVKKGIRIAGGCCGTTPEYISAVTKACKDITPVLTENKNITMVSSYSKTVIFDKKPILIGERINPTGKKLLKQALLENNTDYILNEAIAQQEKGVDIIDVNVGLPEICEETVLKNLICEIQAVTTLPLQIDTSDVSALEAALRRYNGKAMINSVNGKKKSMDLVFPLAKKYGGLIVALTLDEDGIPDKAEGRLKIAEKILKEAENYGIDKKNIIFDPLALAVSTDDNSAKETLLSIKLISEKLGCHTSLGVSNISFGLPARNVINSTFFAMALGSGLSAAIMNPFSIDMMQTYFSFCALSGFDENCASYIDFAKDLQSNTLVQKKADANKEVFDSPLQRAIIKGLKEDAAILTEELLKETAPLEIVQKDIIPALDKVGIDFEKNIVFLPQLLMSAESAKYAFEKIKSSMPAEQKFDKCSIVLATVQGDIHDIGKNIVKLLLENYGFNVTDLGRNVAPETILDKVLELSAPIAGLSALMTTTVPAMEKTIKLLKEKAPECKVVVGGAVLNKEYADSIGADKYAKDAMETVRYADEINNNLK